MIYAMGSVYGSTDEKLPEFVSRKVACIGWPKEEAGALHQMLAHIGVGDIIFIKAHPPSHGLFIKAVGVVDSPEIFTSRDLGSGRSVQWVWVGTPPHLQLGKMKDRYDNFRMGTLYPEFGPEVQEAVIGLLVHRDKAKVLSSRN